MLNFSCSCPYSTGSSKGTKYPFDVPDVELGHHNDNDTEWIQFLFIYKGQRISIYHVFETTSGDLIYQ